MGERQTGPIGLGYRPPSIGFRQSGAGFALANPLGLDSGSGFDGHLLLNIPEPAVMTLVPPPLISDVIGLDRFKAAVLARQIQIAIAKGGQHYPPVPEKEMGWVDQSKIKMRKPAAAKCDALLAKARGALKTNGLKGVSIGVLSGYRPYEHDRRLWNRYFTKYYQATASKRAKLRGGPHGEEAIDRLAHYIRGKKAAPGFSNHSNGNAVDFTTTENKIKLGPDTDDANRAAWRKSWFYKWLAVDKNGAAFSFKQLVTEEWHWDFQG